MFVSYGCGTPHERTDIFNYTLKTMRPCFGVDTGDEDDSSSDAGYETPSQKTRTGLIRGREKVVTCATEMAKNVAQMVYKIGEQDEEKEQTKDADRPDLHLKLQISLQKSMYMFAIPANCPPFVPQYLEDEMKATVEKLSKDTTSTL